MEVETGESPEALGPDKIVSLHGVRDPVQTRWKVRPKVFSDLLILMYAHT